MLNIELLIEEIEENVLGIPPPDRKREVERMLDDYDPNALLELAEAPENIQERIKELDDEKEEIWEWIHEEAQLHNVRI